MCVSQWTSPPWVVKSIDGSSDCGNVPSTTVAGPLAAAGVLLVPVLLLVLLVFDELFELEELPPHAASATTAMSARTAPRTALLCFLIRVLLLRGQGSLMKSMQTIPRSVVRSWFLINPQHPRVPRRGRALGRLLPPAH